MRLEATSLIFCSPRKYWNWARNKTVQHLLLSGRTVDYVVVYLICQDHRKGEVGLSSALGIYTVRTGKISTTLASSEVHGVVCFISGRAQLLHHKMKSILITSFTQITESQPGSCVRSWILVSVHWKRYWQCWNITTLAPGTSHKCSARNSKNMVHKFVRTLYWTNANTKETVSWIAALLVMRCGVTTTRRSQNGSLWSGDMNSPLKKTSMKAFLFHVIIYYSYYHHSKREGSIHEDFF